MDGCPCNSSHSMGKDLRKHHMKIKIIGETFEEPIRVDCQKL